MNSLISKIYFNNKTLLRTNGTIRIIRIIKIIKLIKLFRLIRTNRLNSKPCFICKIPLHSKTLLTTGKKIKIIRLIRTNRLNSKTCFNNKTTLRTNRVIKTNTLNNINMLYLQISENIFHNKTTLINKICFICPIFFNYKTFFIIINIINTNRLNDKICFNYKIFLTTNTV